MFKNHVLKKSCPCPLPGRSESELVSGGFPLVEKLVFGVPSLGRVRLVLLLLDLALQQLEQADQWRVCDTTHLLTSLRSSLNLSTLSPLDLVGRYLASTVWRVSSAKVAKTTRNTAKTNFLSNIMSANKRPVQSYLSACGPTWGTKTVAEDLRCVQGKGNSTTDPECDKLATFIPPNRVGGNWGTPTKFHLSNGFYSRSPTLSTASSIN